MTSASEPASATPPSKKKRKNVRVLLLKLARFLGNHALTLCWVLYAFGILWLLLHPAVTVTTGELKCRGTYISENALLIDQVEARSSYHEVQIVLSFTLKVHLSRDFHKSFLDIPDLPANGCSSNCSAVVHWLETELRKIDRVEAYRHVFADEEAGVKRTNVYGILRASPLADGKESVVLMTHYPNIGVRNGDYSGISVGLAMLKYLVDAKWLAKDIILLFADDDVSDRTRGYLLGTEAWLQAYHLDPFSFLDKMNSNPLPMRAGVIRAAVNIETRGDSRHFNTVGILTAGMNGQLPNLDLVNTAVSAVKRERLPIALDRRAGDVTCKHNRLSTSMAWSMGVLEAYVPAKYKQKLREYLENLHGMLRFMKTLATGPSGSHASFISYNIDSITLELVKDAEQTRSRMLGLRGVLRSLELIVRAMSNLEEKLHQSFFLYVLPNTSTFVSVGEYYYTVPLTIFPAMAHLLYLANRTTGMRLALALAAFMVVEVFGVALLLAVIRFYASRGSSETAALGYSLDNTTTKWWILALVITMGQVVFVGVVLPFLRSFPALSGCQESREWQLRLYSYEQEHEKKEKEASLTSEEDDSLPEPAKQDVDGWRAIKFVVMALLVYAHCILGVLNYPMAIFCAIPMAHFSRIVPVSMGSRLKNMWAGMWLLLSSPLVLFAIGNYLYQEEAVREATFVVDSFVRRLNLFALPYVCCLYFPVHTLSLGIWLTSPAKIHEEKKFA